MPSWGSACFGTFKKDGESPYSKCNESTLPESNYFTVDRKGTSFVELIKKEGATLGLIISGGIDKGSRPKISNLRPGSIAHRSDALAVGDYIVSVNGIRTNKLKHEEIVNLLKNAEDKVTLEVEYEIPISSVEGSLCVCPKVIQIKLEKENDSFGFTLRGGACNDRLRSRPLTITHVRCGGPADRDGIIKAGDRLLAVDGISLSLATLQEAILLLKQINHSALFTVEYDVSVIDAVKNATGPLLVEIDKTPGSQLGISLTSVTIPEHSVIIESIRQASIADRCGALHVGDHVLSIDGLKIDLMTAAEAMQLLKSSSGETVKLEIYPFSQMALRRIVETSVKQSTASHNYLSAQPYTNNSYYNTLTSVGGLSINSNDSYSSTSPTNGSRGICNETYVCSSLNKTILASSSNAASFHSGHNSGFTSVGYADRTEVMIPSDHKGFGFTLQGSSFASDVLMTPPVISAIERGSPAEKCGVLQVGDRILAISEESTEGLTLEDVTQMIADSHSRIVLVTEFHVAEAVVPSSGTFLVKLAKRGADLGISVTAPKNRQLGEPLIIADIKKGSVAHRTGSIQPGDKLLAINSIRTENCTVEDATAILHTCNDIVKLRIQKDETFSDDPDTACAVVYTVELIRRGGPLGITVSEKDPFDPITISGLTENGLAERTGALHVGDKILSINGVSLRGKSLNEAIDILQTCGDTVTLKILKCSCSEKMLDQSVQSTCIHSVPENVKPHATPLPSIDSAVDSWDSCNFDSTARNIRLIENNSHSASDGNIPAMLHTTPIHKETPNFNNEPNVCDQKCFTRNAMCRNSLPCNDTKENWHKVLEDLETCGQSQLLRQIEQTILGFDENGNDANPTSQEKHENGAQCLSGTLSVKNLEELNSQIELLGYNPGERSDTKIACVESDGKECADHSNACNQPGSYSNHLCSLNIPQPIEVHKVTLFKDQVYEDFGFSLSDGKYENGVYINSIRSGGPADLSGLVKPLDRILQVNNVKTYNAGLIVPLIASSGDRLEMVISRPAYDSRSSSGSTLGRISINHPWLDDDVQREGSLSPFPSHSQTQTLTKTL